MNIHRMRMRSAFKTRPLETAGFLLRPKSCTGRMHEHWKELRRHSKSDGLLERNCLAGTQGDAINAILTGAGYNVRLLLWWLQNRLLFVLTAIPMAKLASVMNNRYTHKYRNVFFVDD